MDQITDRRVTVMSKRAEPGLDPESREWMDGLRCAAAERDAILAQLYGLLLHAARHEAGRRNDWLRLNAPDLDGVARQVAADALTAITAQLDAFCGQSRFRTWASKFEARRILRARLAASRRDLAHLPGARRTGPARLDDLLAADPADTGCDLAFHVLDRYAEAELSGTGPENRFPGVAAHLRCCEACHQDYQGRPRPGRWCMR